MTAEIREELLSAYLDGELSAEDRAGVETWLDSSAECRQLLDELRSVRSSMESLPRHKLATDLGPAVLRRAERGVLGDAQPPGVAGKITPGTLARNWWSRGGWRRLVWPAAAIAAALLIALFDSDRKPAQKQVAQTRAPQGETFIGAPQKADAPASPAEATSADSFAQPRDGAASEARREGVAGGKLAEKQKVPLTESPSPDRKLLRPAQSAAAASSASAAGNAAVPADSWRKEAAASPDATLTVICDVSPAFVRDRAFEKLLDEQKIAYRQGDELNMKEADASYRYKKTAKQLVGQPYVVDATPEQVNQIIVILRKDASGVSKIAKDLGAAKPRLGDKESALQEDQPSQLGSNRPGRVKFLLRIVEPQGARNDKP